MLKPKVDKKKRIISFVIMAVMFGGMGFMLYKNFFSTSSGSDVDYTVDESMMMDGGMAGSEIGEENPIVSSEEIANIANGGKNSASFDQIINEILKNSKFLSLAEQSFEEKEFVVGKENPFDSGSSAKESASTVALEGEEVGVEDVEDLDNPLNPPYQGDLTEEATDQQETPADDTVDMQDETPQFDDTGDTQDEVLIDENQGEMPAEENMDMMDIVE